MAASTPLPGSSINPPPTLTPASILVVDDDEMNREVLGRMLKRNGYLVTYAENGHMALDLLQRKRFDLVLLDQMMPGLSGTETLQKLRTFAGAAELPVIMVTARTESEDIVAALEQGANDYIGKPIDFPVALARVRAQLQRMATLESLRVREERFLAATRAAEIALWNWDMSTNRIHFSGLWEPLLGYPPQALSQDPEDWMKLIHSDDLASVVEVFNRKRGGEEGAFEVEHRLLHRNKTYRWMLCAGDSVRDTEGRVSHLAGSLKDVNEAKITDILTGLPNRQRFEQRLQETLRPGADSQVVVLLNLDRFKSINERLSRSGGDAVLKEVAVRLAWAMKGHPDSAARYGGDEFAILVPGVHSREDALRLAQLILSAIKAPLFTDDQVVVLSASIGISFSRADATSHDLLLEAEAALQHAKSSGKDRCSLFEPAMGDRAAARLQLESEMPAALADGQFAVFYQPKIDLVQNRLSGLEALVRWRHPTRGLIPPLDFISLAEETGFIRALGAFVLRRACQDLARWRQLYPVHAAVTVSVNVSGRQLEGTDLISSVRDALHSAQLPATALSLEITESVVLESKGALGLLNEIKTLGVNLEIDDFGTGYSSLGYLHRLPFDTLKIDQSFIRRLHQDVGTAEIVDAIIHLAHKLSLNVVAEGIETEEQRLALLRDGCQLGQGFLFSPPVDSAALEVLLQKEGW